MPLTAEEQAYLAGIIDGEGSISLSRSFAARTRGRYVHPLLRIANTDPALIAWIRKRIPAGAGYTARHERRKDVHHITWACGDAIEVLRLVRRHLVVKREKADLVLNLWEASERARKDAGGYFGNGHPLPDWLVAERERAFAQLKALNERGAVSFR